MVRQAAISREAPSQNVPRPSGMSELEILRTITGGFASFGSAVRLSGLSDQQKSRVLALLAEASTRMMEATNAYLFALGEGRGASPAGPPPAAGMPGPAAATAASSPAAQPAVRLVAG